MTSVLTGDREEVTGFQEEAMRGWNGVKVTQLQPQEYMEPPANLSNKEGPL